MTYLSNVLSNLNFICMFIAAITGAFIVFLTINNIVEQKINYFPYKVDNKKFICIFTIAVLGYVFIPTNLQYDIVKEVREENSQIKQENFELKSKLLKIQLQQEIKELHEDN